MDFYGPSWWGLVVFLPFLVFFALIVVLVLSLRRRSSSARHPPQALRVLEERYARGEIGRDEFLERRAVLRGGQDLRGG